MPIQTHFPISFMSDVYNPLAATWATPVNYDWTDNVTTATGTAGTVGDLVQGVEGWTPMVSSRWRINNGKATCSAASGTTSYLTDILYLNGRLRLHDRIAFQGGGQNSPQYYIGGVGFNPTTGESYYINWNQGGRSFNVNRMYSAGSYPATGYFRMQINDTATYATGATTDWCVVERQVLGDTSHITVKICPDNSGHPDYDNPRITRYSSDTYYSLAVPGYAFVGNGQSGFIPQYPRFETTERTSEFHTASTRVARNANFDLTLNGINTNWRPGNIFKSSSGITINSITVSSTTQAVLHCTSGDDLKTAVITAPDKSIYHVRVCTNPAIDNRVIYVSDRHSKIRRVPSFGTGADSADFVSSAVVYGVGFSADGNYVYMMTSGVNFYKYDLAGTPISTLTFPGASAVRKMTTLPDGNYIVCNYGAQGYELFDSDDNDLGPWNSVALGSIYGACVFYDQALARNTILCAGWGDLNIKQVELDGTFIKVWATGNDEVQVADVVSDSVGDVYAADWGANCIRKYSNDGTYLGVIYSNCSQPHGITILDNDTILAGCEFGTYAGRVKAFTPDGVDLGDWHKTSASTDVQLCPL